MRPRPDLLLSSLVVCVLGCGARGPHANAEGEASKTSEAEAVEAVEKAAKPAEAEPAEVVEPTEPALAPAAPSAGLSGVVAVEGLALAGAEVCAWYRGPKLPRTREDTDVPPCTRADASGGYSLVLDPGGYYVVASARGYLPALEWVVLREATPTQQVDFGLEPGGRAYEGVLANIEAKPIAGAEVAAYARFEHLYVRVGQSRSAVDGSFSVWSQEQSEVYARAPGHARDLVIHQRAEDPYILVPESIIRGRVLDQKGRPVVGARVALSSFLGPVFGYPSDAVRTGPEGRFEIDGLLPDRYRLLAAGGGALGSSEEFHVDFGAPVEDVTITLERAAQPLRARVRGPEGEQVGPCSINLGRSEPHNGSWFTTDHAGDLDTLVPKDMARDAWKVFGLHCPGMVGTPPYAALRAGSKPSSLAVARARELHVHLLTSTGEPLAGADVWAEPPLSSSFDDASSLDMAGFTNIDGAQTDAEGQAVIGGLAPGSYELTVSGWLGFGPKIPVEIGEAPNTPLEHRMPASGRVELRSSLAQAGQPIHIEHCDTRVGGRGWRTTELTDAQGRVVFAHVPPGRLRVGHSQEVDCREERGLEVEVEAGESASVRIEARVDPEWSVVTVDEAGRPLAGVVVEAAIMAMPGGRSKLRWRRASGEAFALSGPDGRAVLKVRRNRDQPTQVFAASVGRIGQGAIEPDANQVQLVLRPPTASDEHEVASEP